MYSDCYNKFGREVRPRRDGIIAQVQATQVIDVDKDFPPEPDKKSGRRQGKPLVIDITNVDAEVEHPNKKRAVLVPDDDDLPHRPIRPVARPAPRDIPHGGYKGKGRRPPPPVARQPVVQSNRFSRRPAGSSAASWHLGRGPARYRRPRVPSPPHHPPPPAAFIRDSFQEEERDRPRSPGRHPFVQLVHDRIRGDLHIHEPQEPYDRLFDRPPHDVPLLAFPPRDRGPDWCYESPQPPPPHFDAERAVRTYEEERQTPDDMGDNRHAQEFPRDYHPDEDSALQYPMAVKRERHTRGTGEEEVERSSKRKEKRADSPSYVKLGREKRKPTAPEDAPEQTPEDAPSRHWDSIPPHDPQNTHGHSHRSASPHEEASPHMPTLHSQTRLAQDEAEVTPEPSRPKDVPSTRSPVGGNLMDDGQQRGMVRVKEEPVEPLHVEERCELLQPRDAAHPHPEDAQEPEPPMSPLNDSHSEDVQPNATKAPVESEEAVPKKVSKKTIKVKEERGHDSLPPGKEKEDNDRASELHAKHKSSHSSVSKDRKDHGKERHMESHNSHRGVGSEQQEKAGLEEDMTDRHHSLPVQKRSHSHSQHSDERRQRNGRSEDEEQRPRKSNDKEPQAKHHEPAVEGTKGPSTTALKDRHAEQHRDGEGDHRRSHKDKSKRTKGRDKLKEGRGHEGKITHAPPKAVVVKKEPLPEVHQSERVDLPVKRHTAEPPDDGRKKHRLEDNALPAADHSSEGPMRKKVKKEPDDDGGARQSAAAAKDGGMPQTSGSIANEWRRRPLAEATDNPRLLTIQDSWAAPPPPPLAVVQPEMGTGDRNKLTEKEQLLRHKVQELAEKMKARKGSAEVPEDPRREPRDLLPFPSTAIHNVLIANAKNDSHTSASHPKKADHGTHHSGKLGAKSTTKQEKIISPKREGYDSPGSDHSDPPIRIRKRDTALATVPHAPQAVDGDEAGRGSSQSPFRSPPVPKLSKGKGMTYDIFGGTATPPQISHAPRKAVSNANTGAHLSDNWDDIEGYYQIKVGEAFPESGRYIVRAIMGKGVFGTVVRAVDTHAPLEDDGAKEKEVAVKMARNNHVMMASAEREIHFLKSIMQSDKNNKSRCIRMFDHFKYREHVCIVEELMSMNMRQALKKYGMENGREVGLNIDAVRLYARDMLVGLRFFKRNGIIHADIKPDNILLNEKRTGVKFCDLGSATTIDNFEVTPYLVSRYYRAPEIILGTPKPDYGIDIWSVACTLFEMATGRVLFPGRDNNNMLRRFMDLKGKFPNRLLRTATFRVPHFDEDLNFLESQLDPVTNKEIIKKISFFKPVHDLKALLGVDQAPEGEQKQKLTQLANMLEGCLQLDPQHRSTVEQAFYHPFVYSDRQRQAREQKEQEKQARRELKAKGKAELKHSLSKSANK